MRVACGCRAFDRADAERARIRAFAERCEVLYPDDRFPRIFGEATAGLRSRGSQASVMDLLIAVCAIVAGARLLTRERKGLVALPGLAVERL